MHFSFRVARSAGRRLGLRGPARDEPHGDTDEDCDGLADDEDASATGQATWYTDADEDGYGAAAVQACEAPPGSVTLDGDCDDSDDNLSPGEPELCDGSGVDEDCDGLANEADPDVVGMSTFYADADGDGFGDAATATEACFAAAGVVSDSADCDDTDAGVNPAAAEVCDDLDTDEDCDGLADDADDSATGQSSFYVDADGDSYGSAAATESAATQVGITRPGTARAKSRAAAARRPQRQERGGLACSSWAWSRAAAPRRPPWRRDTAPFNPLRIPHE